MTSWILPTSVHTTKTAQVAHLWFIAREQPTIHILELAQIEVGANTSRVNQRSPQQSIAMNPPDQIAPHLNPHAHGGISQSVEARRFILEYSPLSAIIARHNLESMIFCVTEGSSQNLVRAVHLNIESWVVIMLCSGRKDV